MEAVLGERFERVQGLALLMGDGEKKRTHQGQGIYVLVLPVKDLLKQPPHVLSSSPDVSSSLISRHPCSSSGRLCHSSQVERRRLDHDRPRRPWMAGNGGDWEWAAALWRKIGEKETSAPLSSRWRLIQVGASYDAVHFRPPSPCCPGRSSLRWVAPPRAPMEASPDARGFRAATGQSVGPFSIDGSGQAGRRDVIRLIPIESKKKWWALIKTYTPLWPKLLDINRKSDRNGTVDRVVTVDVYSANLIWHS
jgi:hypothetical protein